MGHKVHPVGFRLGLHQEWLSRWFDKKNYARLIQEDVRIRQGVMARYAESGIARIDIERQGQMVTLIVHTSRPGMVIGRDGKRVEEMRQFLEGLVSKRVKITVNEIYQPELNSYLLARSIAEQIERRIAYRRAMRQAAARSMQAGAKGVHVTCSGRLGGNEIARRERVRLGQMPLQTIRANIDYGFTEAKTVMGRIGIKVWIYKGDVLPVLVQPEGTMPGQGAKDATTQTS